MVEYILGKYLVEISRLTEEQLADVLSKQDQARVKLGLIAVSEGMMTNAQAEEVNRLQAVMDKRFGDIAVEKGYLNELQISTLLRKQGSTYLMFAQTLVDMGLMELPQIEETLTEYARINGFTNADMEDLKSDDADRIVPLFLPEQAQEFKTLFQTVVRTLIRLIDRHIYVGRATVTGKLPEGTAARQRMEGESGLIDMFSEESGALVSVCSVFARDTFTQWDEDSMDAAGELLNCVNGLYVSALSADGRFLELMPPEYSRSEDGICRESICTMPLYLNHASFNLTAARLS